MTIGSAETAGAEHIFREKAEGGTLGPDRLLDQLRKGDVLGGLETRPAVTFAAKWTRDHRTVLGIGRGSCSLTEVIDFRIPLPVRCLRADTKNMYYL